MLGMHPVAGSPLAAVFRTLPSAILASKGTYALSGQVATLTWSARILPAGSYAVSGAGVSFTLSFSQESAYRTLLVGSTAHLISGYKMIANFSMTQGDTKTLVVSVKDAEGNAVSITDATIKWRAARSYGKTAVVSKSTVSGVQITNGAGGVFAVALLPADTEDLIGTYFHEAEVTFADGTVSTVLTGTMKINKQLIAS